MKLQLPSLQNLARYLIMAGLSLAILAVAVFFYWSVSGNQVLDVKNDPFPVRTIRESPTAGGVVILHVNFCKLVAVDGKLRMSFLNHTHEVFLPLTRERSDVGCQNTELPVLIPTELPPGEYRIKFRVGYQVNPIKRVIEEYHSKPFEVVEE